MKNYYDYIVVGGGVAGFKSAETIRRYDQQGSILLVNNEDRIPYKRTKISKTLAVEAPLNAFVLAAKGWYHAQGIELVADEVLSFSIKAKSLSLKQGGRHQFNKLILCTGSAAIIPVLKGQAKKDIMLLRTAADHDRIKNTIKANDKVIVSGGGVEGIELAEQALKMGASVTLVHNNFHLLNKHFDKHFAGLIHQLLADNGIQVIFNESIRSLSNTGNGKKLVQIGDLIHTVAEHILVSNGSQPRTELGRRAGLEVNKGILVDAYMQTSSPDIYAAGDVAEHAEGVVTGLWHAAEAQGVVAGSNAAGEKIAYHQRPYRLKLDIFDQYFFSLNMPASIMGYEVVHWRRNQAEYSCYFKDNKLQGMLMANDKDKAKLCEQAVHEHWSMAKTKKQLG
ncbi:MAG: FAD-dependent oxidoreductase [Bacteroidetes bacterium]|nr:FAD-dependent oxidoreductase [Bacteroidota bacterium]